MECQNIVYLYFSFPSRLEEGFITDSELIERQGPHKVLLVDVLTSLSGKWLLKMLRKYRENNNHLHMHWLLTLIISGNKQHHCLLTPFTHVIDIPRAIYAHMMKVYSPKYALNFVYFSNSYFLDSVISLIT